LLKKTQPRTKHEVDRMTRCWVMFIWRFSQLDRRSDIGHAGDFIFCPMLRYAVHWTDNIVAVDASAVDFIVGLAYELLLPLFVSTAVETNNDAC